MATVALSGIITPTNVVTATSTTTLTNKTLTGAVMNGTLGATTPSTVVATTVKASTTMGVGGATPSGSGSGISFPATQSASTDANTLDDYEEGTWTPTATNVNITSATGTYTKIGRYIYLTFYGVWPNNSNGNAVVVQGLPFTSKTISAGTGGASISYNGSNTDFYATVNSNTTNIEFYQKLGAQPTNANFSTKDISFSISYLV
jgi:hypothetical protein